MTNLWAIEYKAKNGKWVYNLEFYERMGSYGERRSGVRVRDFPTKKLASAFIDTVPSLRGFGRPVKVKIERDK